MKVSNLKSYLANIGMSLKDFCQLIDVSDKHMSKVMNGNKKASHRLAKDVKELTDGIVILETTPRKRDQKDKKNQQEKEKPKEA